MKRKLSFLGWIAALAVLPLGFVGCATDDSSRDRTDRTTGEFIDDKVLIQRVKSALGDNNVYKFSDVKVNTYRGTVQLSGFVQTDEQKRKAEEIAKTVRGVYNVENNITMKSETERVRGTPDLDGTVRTNTNVTIPPDRSVDPDRRINP